MQRDVDLNCDLGESFGPWRMGDDAAMFAVVSSANVACGFHAGDPLTMLASCRAAAEHEVAVGAHVSYRDLAGFGRRAMDIASDELRGDVLYQVSALAGMAQSVGTRVTYVKPHGALYNRIVRDRVQADAVAGAVRDANPALALVGLADSEISRAAERHGLRFVCEAFVDRAYLSDGSLVPRSVEGAVLHDSQAIAARAVGMVRSGEVLSIDGVRIRVAVDSLCVHGDTPGAVAIAREVRRALAAAGVGVAAFAPARPDSARESRPPELRNSPSR